ncbi:retrovirus-related pol polyprotein from transposon TNT 1-94 [Tanacetum coccineum]
MATTHAVCIVEEGKENGSEFLKSIDERTISDWELSEKPLAEVLKGYQRTSRLFQSLHDARTSRDNVKMLLLLDGGGLRFCNSSETEQTDLRDSNLISITRQSFTRCRCKGDVEAIKSRFGGNEESKKNKANDNSKRLGKKEESNALMTLDEGCVDWTSRLEDEQDNYAFMACNSSGSDTERNNVEMQYRTTGIYSSLKMYEANSCYITKLTIEAEKVKEDLKAKVEKWHNSSKNLGKLLNTQMSVNDKFGLGYGDYRYNSILSYENEVLQSVFMNKEGDLENQPLYDRFVTAEGMHVVPPPMTGNYMPSGPDIEIDYSQFTYGPKQSQPTVNEPKVVSQPKVWSDAPIIHEYESDSKDEHVSIPTKEQEIPRLPKDIYTLINHYTDAKDIWDNVKMLLEGSELTKEDRESQLYDDFEHFRQNKGETIHDYYVRFAKLINDMRNIKMTMSRMQLNSKFVNNMLPEWGRFVTAVKLNRGLRDSNYDQLYAYLKQHEAHANENKMMLDRFTQHTVDPLALMSNGRQNRGQGNNARGAGAAGYGGAQNRVGNANPGQARQVKCYNCNGIGHIARNCTQPKRPQNSEYFKDKMLLMQAQENGVALDEEQLLFIAGGQDNAIDEDVDEQPVQDLALNVDNVFQADDCDAFDSDVDEAPTAQTMFMANLSSADPVYDEAGPSYDSDILSEVHDHDHYQDAVCEHHEEHEMHDDVQPNYVVDSHANYTSDSNMIPYDQYVKDNAVPVVQSNVSSVPNDAYMMIFNDMHEPHAQSVSDTTRNTVVDNSLTAELATYKEQVELYERRARFELTEREQKIDEQLRIVITDRNIKEENLKKELHSVKMQLASTINHNKSMVEEVTSLKKDFKQKENKYLEEFLDMKALKEKVEDKLYKQDQSLQTVHMLCKPKPYYNEQNKVAIGYKNPLCLTRAKQVQPALYNGYEIIKNNHVPALVHNTEDTLEIAEITRRKMNDKMKDPECVTHKVKIAPPDYSKENYLATFTPQKQLTPEQIFWSQDLIKMKEEALKKQTTASRPIKALTVYPPNTPATLVPRVLPTKSQVKINIFALIQLFSEFEKTCKKRITPTGLTEGERGFEQTKECYLTEVIPFFKTLKEHFEGIQKALTKEIKEMKDIFEELEAEVDQNVVNRKHDEIERKNLLIANDNLIVDCLSKEVFYIATNSELTVSRVTEMHEAHTIVQTRCLELEAELSKLRDKVQKDDHTELVKRFSNLEVNHLNLQLKYQNLKESFVNDPSPPTRDTPDFDSVFITHAKHIEQTTALLTKNENLKAQIHENLKCNTMESVKPRVLTPSRYAIDVEPIPPHNRNNREVHLYYLKHLNESVETLREIVEEAKVERPLDISIVSACRYTKHSQELLEYMIDTCLKDYNQRDKKHDPTPLIRKKQVTFKEQCDTSHSNIYKHVEELNTQKTNAPVPPSTRVSCCTDASESQPRSNTKKNKISPAKGVNKMKVEEHPKTNKSHLRTTDRVDSSSISKHTIINSNSNSVCQTCNKCLIFANHDMYMVDYLQSVKAPPSIHNIHNAMRKVKQAWKPKQVRLVWKPTGKVLTSVGHQWRPMGRIFTLGEQCPLTSLTKPKVVSAAQNEN